MIFKLQGFVHGRVPMLGQSSKNTSCLRPRTPTPKATIPKMPPGCETRYTAKSTTY